MTNRTTAVVLAAGVLGLGILEASGHLMPVNQWMTERLIGVGKTAPLLNAIWIVGGVPLTGTVVILAAWRRHHWRWLAAFVAGLILEIAYKHWVWSALPQPISEPAWLAPIQNWASPSAGSVLRLMREGLGGKVAAAVGQGFFHSSYFSGHVYRITFATGVLARWRVVPIVVASATMFCVIATGGHWLVDALGGLAMAESALAAAQ